jgi:hypothetical protein
LGGGGRHELTGGGVDFVRERPQVQVTPARNFASLAARSAGEGRGNGEEG